MRSAVTTENPLYEKLYHRFSCNGKTVGEMMLSRAKSSGSGTGHDRSELRDLTAERCITCANLLPREGAAAARVAPAFVRPFALLRRDPCAILALFLSVFIFSYLLVAGIRQKEPSTDAFLAIENDLAVICVQENDPAVINE